MHNRLRRRATNTRLLPLALAAGLLVAVQPGQSQAVVPLAGEPSGDSALAGETVPGSYVVVYRDQRLSAGESHREARDLVDEHGGDIEHQYGRSLDGFSAELTSDEARAIAADPRVDHVEPVYRVHPQDVDVDPDNWGDDRIDQRDLPLSGSYEYPANAGQGVHVYQVDTGINAAHDEFVGRVGAGRDIVDNDSSPDDCNGHGTHVAGTAVGTTYGVARGATIHAVRIFDCAGDGSTDDIIAGVEWIRANAVRPAVVNMSIGCDEPCISTALDAAVSNLIASGISVVQAAGNTSDDACLLRGTQAPGTITVGASTISDSKAAFSNYGSCVDIWAPGTDILSAAYDNAHGFESISGTSMATPHVTGAVALYLGLNPSATPAQVRNAILANATLNKLSGLDAASPNKLLYMGFLLHPEQEEPEEPETPPECGARTMSRDLRIRDFRTATSRLTLSCVGAAATSSRVTIRIAHTAVGDLTVTLVAPDGSSYLLQRRAGGRTNNLNRSYVRDLSRETIKGTWKLVVKDRRRSDHGRLKSWTLDL